MKILLIGDFSENYDEGYKNISKYLFDHLSSRNTVETLNIKKLISKNVATQFGKFSPDIIHQFTGPTVLSFVFLKLLSVRWPDSCLVVSALHSGSSSFLKSKIISRIIRFFCKPDVILYQEGIEKYNKIANKVVFFPNGVDTTRFHPVDAREKDILREKYSIDKNKFVVLHVGHFFEKRNLDIFASIQKMDPAIQVIIIGGTYLAKDTRIIQNLERNGCITICGYIRRIEEIYALSDCYVFPVLWGDTINQPLSIFEAMASNLPVVCLNYPSLSIFNNCPGIFLVSNTAEIPEKVRVIYHKKKLNHLFDTRNPILEFSWESLARKLEHEIYCPD